MSKIIPSDSNIIQNDVLTGDDDSIREMIKIRKYLIDI